MTFSVEKDHLKFEKTDLTGSHKSASGKVAQAIAESIWPNYNPYQEVSLVEMMNSLGQQFQSIGVTRDMITSTVNYLVTASHKHHLSPGVQLMQIRAVVDLLRLTKDQMFPEES